MSEIQRSVVFQVWLSSHVRRSVVIKPFEVPLLFIPFMHSYENSYEKPPVRRSQAARSVRRTPSVRQTTDDMP
jgi:hypothetical protein